VVQDKYDGALRPSLSWAALRRAAVVIVPTALVAAGLGLLISSFQPVAYEAQARLVLSSSESFDPLGQNNTSDPGRFVLNQIEIITSSLVLAPAAADLSTPATLDDLSDSIDVAANSDSDVITIRATRSTAADAAARANAVADGYRSFILQDVTERAAVAIAGTSLPEQVAAIQTAAAVYGDGVAVAEPAVPPAERAEPQPLRNAILLGLVAALVALGVLRYVAPRPRKTKTAQQGLSRSPVRTLAHISVPDRGGDDAVALAYRRNLSQLASTLTVLDAFHERGAVLVTGTKRHIGASGATLQLALTAVGQGRRVAIIECDVHGGGLFTGSDGTLRPIWRAASDRTRREPLHRLDDDRVDPSRVLRACTVAGQEVWLVTATADDLARGLVALRSRLGALERLAGLADLILIDAPPALADPAGLRMLPVADAVVLVSDRADDPDAEVIAGVVGAAGGAYAGLLVVTRDVKAARPMMTPMPVPAGSAADMPVASAASHHGSQ